jgi:hypothetical protein
MHAGICQPHAISCIGVESFPHHHAYPDDYANHSYHAYFDCHYCHAYYDCHYCHAYYANHGYHRQLHVDVSVQVQGHHVPTSFRGDVKIEVLERSEA